LTKIIKRFIPQTIWKRLRRGRRASVEAYYRLIANQLISHASRECTWLSYLFEVQPFNSELVIKGISMGICPMTPYREGYVRWNDPDPRAVLPIKDFHVPKNMKILMRKGHYEVRVDEAFRQIVEKCAEGRDETHITPQYVGMYTQLHQMGYAHSIGVWKNGELVGGRFGVALGGYFIVESSFYRARDAGKIALIRSAEILAAGGFVLHDVGFPDYVLKHMAQFGGYSLSREEFHKLHAKAIITPAHFDPNAPPIFTAS
jgi:leucyl/phenylalanyl-tRNA--protein transferase